RDQIAFLIELQNRGRRSAALRNWRIRCRVYFTGFERPCAVNDPDMILSIDRHADRLTHNPMVRQRLRPQRIHFKPRSRYSGSLDSRSLLQEDTRYRKRPEQREKHRTRVNLTFHAQPPQM